MSFLCVFLDPHLTTWHPNAGVILKQVAKLGPLTFHDSLNLKLCKWDPSQIGLNRITWSFSFSFLLLTQMKAQEAK